MVLAPNSIMVEEVANQVEPMLLNILIGKVQVF